MNKADSKFYKKLDLDSNASKDEVKNRYRELAKKYHPDNLNTGNSDKFKEITEAYQAIQNPPETVADDLFENSGFYPFGRRAVQKEYDVSHIAISLNTSFEESVLGTNKEISFNRKIKCATCNGQGIKAIHNGCNECNGTGQKIKKQQGMVFVSTCPKCRGKTSTTSCVDCSSTGVLNSEISLNVTIPAGIKDGNILRLSQMGNYIGNFGPLEQHTDVMITISVTPDSDLSLQNNIVVSKLSISLEEAVKGCRKSVKTIFGPHDIDIPVMSKNKDEIIIPRVGLARHGDQKVILDVQYPPNILKMINSLLES